MKQGNYWLCFVTIFSFLCLTTNNPTIAQIIPDTSLPNNSIAIPNGNSIRIEGGTSTGGNLFHSFQEFSVPNGNEAFFNNGLDIQNIFSRVTGSNISNIDGLIRANGTANLFIINPNGMIFGENAQLNIGGSFFGSTASSIRFIDGSEFNATNPTASSSLLTVNVPIGLQFGENPGRIVNRSRSLPLGVSQTTSPANIPSIPLPIPISNNVGLAVQPGQTLALIGGDIQLDGGNLTASTGQIILGSVASPGRVSFTPTIFGLTLNYDNIPNFGNIDLSNGAIVNTTGLGGGKVDIRGRNVTLSGARIYGLTLGNIDGFGIDINAQNLLLQDGATISTLALGEGKGGDINIRATDSVETIGIGFDSFQQAVSKVITSGAFDPFEPHIVLETATANAGASGNITIDTGRLLMRDGVTAVTTTLGAGNGGNITIRANVFDLAGSGIFSGTGQGSSNTGGNISFTGEQLIVRDGAILTSVTRSEQASGNITIKAAESVEVLRSLAGTAIQTLIASSSLDANGKGQAGDITIDTKRLNVAQGAGITVGSGGIIGTTIVSSGGPGGNLTIKASESIEVAGISGVLANGDIITSYLSSATTSPNQGGNLHIATPVLTLRDGGVIYVSSLSTGNAGSLTIDASSIEVIGTALNNRFISQIDASAGNIFGVLLPNATGNAGSIDLNASRLIVRDGAAVNVRAVGKANAGNINVVADTIDLDNKGSINGTTDIGGGGNVNLHAQNIQLRHNSRIATDAGNATGGNITIDTNTLVALENSDITANAVRGSGGRVSITPKGIFGTQFRNELTPQSDITATSDLGPPFSGTVQINISNVALDSGLVELATTLVNVNIEALIAINFCTSQQMTGSSFVITGWGGLPPNPDEPFTDEIVAVEWATREPKIRRVQAENFTLPDRPLPITEARGWQMNQKGEVELVANASGVTFGSPWNSVPSCGVQ